MRGIHPPDNEERRELYGLNFKQSHGYKGLGKFTSSLYMFSGGAVVHPVPSRGHSVWSGPERSGAGDEAAGAAGGPQRDRLSEIPPAVQPQ